MNWLMAPAFASTGRVVTQSPFSFLEFSFSNSLSADCRRRLHLAITPNRGSDACAARHAAALIQQHFFKRREEEQHVRLLAAEAHQADSPDLTFHRSESAGDFDIEFVEQLIAHFRIV